MKVKSKHISRTLPTRIDKTLIWLIRSRDTWKEKCKNTKLALKRQTFTIKRLKDGRAALKLTSTQLKLEVSRSKETIHILQQRIQELETQVTTSSNKINDLKKKPFGATKI